MKTIPIANLISPYNFVPAPKVNVWPKWHGRASHDTPFDDGICGSLTVEIEAQTALFVGGGPGTTRDGKDVETFYQDGRGRLAIPGTSLRGMLRNVVEIASFGRIGPVNDQRVGFRDLQHRDYTDAMNSNVNAGWLMREGDDWVIKACDYAKIDYQLLDRLGGRAFIPGKKQGAAEKYAAFKGSLDLAVAVKLLDRNRPSAPIVSRYCEVTRLDGRVNGTLVFTGQPSKFPGTKDAKHSDFFFMQPTGHSFPVSDQQRRDFEFIHAADRQQGRDTLEPNPEWKFWKEQPQRPVPVFFLLEEAEGGAPRLRAFGLAGMFRLAADQRVTDVVRAAQAKLPNGHRQQPDLAALVFGYVSDGKAADGPEKGALKGRVSVGMGRVEGTPRTANKPVEAVFGVPKPSFYPYYLQHGRPHVDDAPPGKRNQIGRINYQWHTYMSVGGREVAKARGWKRYVVRRKANRRPFVPRSVLEEEKEQLLTRFLPLEPGARFTAKIRVHNLRPIEIGALLWAIDFGQTDGACHRLGRGRPHGFGAVRLRIGQTNLTWARPVQAQGAADDLAAHRAAFMGYMQHETGNWATSRTLFELVQLAQALPEEQDARIDYPRLDPEHRRNQFKDIKQGGLVLRPLGGRQRWERWRRERRELLARQEPEALPTEGWVEASFADTIAARVVRKLLAKDIKRMRRQNKTSLERSRLATLRLGADHLVEADLAALAGIVDFVKQNPELQHGLAFFVRLEAGVPVAIAVTDPR